MCLTASYRARTVKAHRNRAMSPRFPGAFPRGGSSVFISSRSRPVPRPPSRSTPVMAVGQRVFVNSAGNRSGSVTLADVSGKVLSTVHLADGIEVEVVAWRPCGVSGTRYRVREPHGADGWLPAENLRRVLTPLPPPEPPTSAQARIVADAGGRRFGQRSQPERAPSAASLPPTSLPPARPAPAVAGGGRRFGQHFETERSPTPASPTPAPATTDADAKGRRFGQH